LANASGVRTNTPNTLICAAAQWAALGHLYVQNCGSASVLSHLLLPLTVMLSVDVARPAKQGGDASQSVPGQRPDHA
jgi:hypothetical protein